MLTASAKRAPRASIPVLSPAVSIAWTAAEKVTSAAANAKRGIADQAKASGHGRSPRRCVCDGNTEEVSTFYAEGCALSIANNFFSVFPCPTS